MMDDRQLLERALRGFEPEPGLAERVMRRRDRKRRNQRIRAGILGGIIALALALAATRPMFIQEPVETPTPTPTVPIRVGFLDVPPEGAVPSLPIVGRLVLSIRTSLGSTYVYEDGRMIWERHGNDPTGVPEGATDRSTGYLEQRLSPEGVELLRSTVLDTGILDADLALEGRFEGSERINDTSIHVRGPNGLVSLAWNPGSPDERWPTKEEREAILHIKERLADPGAWLPDIAWIDQEIRAYVAPAYGVNISLILGPDGECCYRPDPADLPPPSAEILGRAINQCLTTDEARRLFEGFEAAGLPSKVDSSFTVGSSWEIPTPAGVEETQYLLLYPVLPDWGCKQAAAESVADRA